MSDEIFIKGMKPGNLLSLDLSYATNLATGVQAQMEESRRRTQQIGEDVYNNRQKMQKAMEQTAINTAETNVQLQKVVENQNEYIDALKSQLSTQQQHLELDKQQLDILKNIFASSKDGMMVEKEIMKLIQERIDSDHPLWDYVKDKGGDIAVAGVTAGVPFIYAAIKQYLASKGILLP